MQTKALQNLRNDRQVTSEDAFNSKLGMSSEPGGALPQWKSEGFLSFTNTEGKNPGGREGSLSANLSQGSKSVSGMVGD